MVQKPTHSCCIWHGWVLEFPFRAVSMHWRCVWLASFQRATRWASAPIKYRAVVHPIYHSAVLSYTVIWCLSTENTNSKAVTHPINYCVYFLFQSLFSTAVAFTGFNEVYIFLLYFLDQNPVTNRANSCNGPQLGKIGNSARLQLDYMQDESWMLRIMIIQVRQPTSRDQIRNSVLILSTTWMAIEALIVSGRVWIYISNTCLRFHGLIRLTLIYWLLLSWCSPFTILSFQGLIDIKPSLIT